ncbi:MAG: alpha-E domain-containing protein, partial [Chloroflexi bacterium]|nr:alpha-E domain-containing protein [Chloroflexota bacterium]
MLARVAENLYWLGRYIERAENEARLIDVERLTGIARTYGGGDPWEFVLDTLGAEDAFKTAKETNPALTAEQYLVFSPESPFSIRTSVTHSRTLAMELREHSSREVFEAINRLYHSVNAASNGSIEIGMM